MQNYFSFLFKMTNDACFSFFNPETHTLKKQRNHPGDASSLCRFCHHSRIKIDLAKSFTSKPVIRLDFLVLSAPIFVTTRDFYTD